MNLRSLNHSPQVYQAPARVLPAQRQALPAQSYDQADLLEISGRPTVERPAPEMVGATAYLPGPSSLLPESLSQDVCSLGPAPSAPVLEFTVSADGTARPRDPHAPCMSDGFRLLGS